MKNYLLVIFLFVVVCALLYYAMPQKIENLVGEGNLEVSFRYFDGKVQSKTVSCKRSELKKVTENAVKVDGVTVTVCGNRVESLIDELDATVWERQTVDGIEIVCGFSPKVCGGVAVDGRVINIQIAYCNGNTKVGSPLILGGF